MVLTENRWFYKTEHTDKVTWSPKTSEKYYECNILLCDDNQ